MSTRGVVLVYLIPLAGTLLLFPALLLLYFERITQQLLSSLQYKQDALETQIRFVDMFSHEYRTPLAVIRTNLDILYHKDKRNGEQYGANLNKMQRAVLRLVEVAESALLRNANADGKVEMDCEPIHIADFMQDIIREAAELWSERVPRFQLEVMDAPPLLGDHKLLKTACLNLLDNAIKYGPRNGVVMVQVTATQTALTLTVSDEGPGIPEHELALVYGKYFRGSHTSPVPGSGIGLYLVQCIVAQHAGTISLKNRPTGGIAASITLPFAAKDTDDDN